MFAEFNQKMHEVESASLEDRREARRAWENALQDAALIAERVGWLLDGSYGYGAYTAAAEVMGHKRMNRAAWLGQAIAAYEWGCPPNFAREAWNKIPAEQQRHITALINAEIARYEKENA